MFPSVGPQRNEIKTLREQVAQYRGFLRSQKASEVLQMLREGEEGRSKIAAYLKGLTTKAHWIQATIDANLSSLGTVPDMKASLYQHYGVAQPVRKTRAPTGSEKTGEVNRKSNCGPENAAMLCDEEGGVSAPTDEVSVPTVDNYKCG